MLENSWYTLADLRHHDGCGYPGTLTVTKLTRLGQCTRCGCPLANKPTIVTRNWFPSQIHNIKQSYYCVNMHTRGLGQVTTIKRWHFWIKPSISSLTTGLTSRTDSAVYCNMRLVSLCVIVELCDDRRIPYTSMLWPKCLTCSWIMSFLAIRIFTSAAILFKSVSPGDAYIRH